MNYIFKSNTEWQGNIKDYSEKQIIEEPKLYGASIEFAYENGGIITKAILDKIEEDVENLIPRMAKKGYHPVIDTKVAMLMPGWYPCIPGWHCDGVIRNDRNSQPNLKTLNEEVYHYTCIVGTEGISGTEFLDMNLDLHEDQIDKNNVWKSVNDYINSRSIKVRESEMGSIIRFTRSTLHQCTESKVRGWRYFFRLSFYHMPVMNQFQKQIQIYTKNTGW